MNPGQVTVRGSWRIYAIFGERETGLEPATTCVEACVTHDILLGQSPLRAFTLWRKVRNRRIHVVLPPFPRYHSNASYRVM